MSRRFRICMAKGGRESARPSYGRPKWTLISREKKIPKTVFQKTFRPQFLDFSLEIESAVFWYIWNIADSMADECVAKLDEGQKDTLWKKILNNNMFHHKLWITIILLATMPLCHNAIMPQWWRMAEMCWQEIWLRTSSQSHTVKYPAAHISRLLTQQDKL